MKNIVFIILLIIIIFLAVENFHKNKEIDNLHANISKKEQQTEIEATFQDDKESKKDYENDIKFEKKLTDWKLTLVNYENELPDNYNLELANIDNSRQFDKRAIYELNEMLKALKENGINNIWVQSAYRSIEYQNNLFNEKVNTYKKQGKTQEEAERLTLQTINKPGTSEHNLGLAVDFNYVDYSFEKSKGFKWLEENAENYGFILRYRKDKEEITKVDYEPWHWRYVGKEYAKEINELDMCLEEYIDYLNNNLYN